MKYEDIIARAIDWIIKWTYQNETEMNDELVTGSD